MNREIKFRAWNEKHSIATLRMMYEVYINPEGKVGHPDGEYYELPLMQFTGLKDKNGKEIYEGDILKTFWQHDGVSNYDYELVGEVKWDEEWLHFMIEKDKGDSTIAYPLHSFEQDELDAESIEVIGNIYENPNLINQQP